MEEFEGRGGDIWGEYPVVYVRFGNAVDTEVGLYLDGVEGSRDIVAA
jgi:hypothetical protein